MHKLLILLLGLTLFLLLGYWCVYIEVAPAIQKDIASRATKALTDIGFGHIKLEVSGRDIILSGTVADASMRGRIDKAVQLEGVRLVTDRIKVSQPVPRNYPFRVESKNNQLIIHGWVPDANTHHNLIAYAMELFRDKDIKDELSEQHGAPENWIVAVRAGLDALQQLISGKLQVNTHTVDLSGVSASTQQRDSIIQALSEQLDSREVRADIRVQAPLPDEIHVDLSSDLQQKMTARECQQRTTSLLEINAIKFHSGSSIIIPSSQQTLDILVPILQQCTQYRTLIRGHTDVTGSKALNLRLSQERATAVKAYFASKGLPAEQITAQGVGESEPIADNATPEGRKQNRRIEIIIMEGS